MRKEHRRKKVIRRGLVGALVSLGMGAGILLSAGNRQSSQTATSKAETKYITTATSRDDLVMAEQAEKVEELARRFPDAYTLYCTLPYQPKAIVYNEKPGVVTFRKDPRTIAIARLGEGVKEFYYLPKEVDFNFEAGRDPGDAAIAVGNKRLDLCQILNEKGRGAAVFEQNIEKADLGKAPEKVFEEYSDYAAAGALELFAANENELILWNAYPRQDRTTYPPNILFNWIYVNRETKERKEFPQSIREERASGEIGKIVNPILENNLIVNAINHRLKDCRNYQIKFFDDNSNYGFCVVPVRNSGSNRNSYALILVNIPKLNEKGLVEKVGGFLGK